MSFNLDIPKELAHLKKDSRGYPVPYFVSYIDGKPEFRFLKPERLQMIIENKLCHICGKKLLPNSFYFIAGPIGLNNRTSTDAAMHKVCAEFSLVACPHLFFEKAERRDNDELGRTMLEKESPILRDKPDTVYLVWCDKFKHFMEGGRLYIRYRPITSRKFVYENNRLTESIG